MLIQTQTTPEYNQAKATRKQNILVVSYMQSKYNQTDALSDFNNLVQARVALADSQFAITDIRKANNKYVS